MAATRRLVKELQDIRAINLKGLRDLVVDEANILQWKCLIVPENEPYNKGAFCIQIDFPPEYPFKPPEVTFLTKIYHPNIDEKGRVCLNIICTCTWKPATMSWQVIQALISLPPHDNPGHTMRRDLVEEYTKDRDKFLKNAEEFTIQFSEKRPSD